MSLINEALKKAQRQRSLEAAPLSSAPSGVAAAAVTTHVRAASHRRSYAPLWFGLGLVLLGGGATALVMHYGINEAPTASSVSTPSATPALIPAAAPAAAVTPLPIATPPASRAPLVTPAPELAAPTAPVAVVTLPPIATAEPPRATAAATSPAPAQAKAQTPTYTPAQVPPATPKPLPSPALPATSTAAATTPVPVAPVAAAQATSAEREARIYTFLNTLRLTGVRGLGREARVLMNERVWRLNDIVSPELGLRLSAVRPNLLVFTDAQGKTYEKPY